MTRFPHLQNDLLCVECDVKPYTLMLWLPRQSIWLSVQKNIWTSPYTRKLHPVLGLCNLLEENKPLTTNDLRTYEGSEKHCALYKPNVFRCHCTH